MRMPRRAAAAAALTAAACAGAPAGGDVAPLPAGLASAAEAGAIHQFRAKPQGLRDHVAGLHEAEWAQWPWSRRVAAIETFEESSRRAQKGVDPSMAAGWYYFNENTGESTYARPAPLGHPDPKNGNRLYWVDPVSGEAVWKMPEQWDWGKTVDGDRVYYWNRQTQESRWQRNNDAAWVRIEKPHYWWNDVTNETSHDRPRELGMVDPQHPGTLYWVDAVTGKTVWEVPKEFDWHTHKDDQQQEYYSNAQTKETVWEKPAVLGWKRISREDKFWFNEVTKKSQWARPAEMGVMSEDPAHKGAVYWIDPLTKQATWQKPSLWDWKMVKADDSQAALMGHTHYYYNPGQKAQWDKPECLGWHEVPVQHSEEAGPSPAPAVPLAEHLQPTLDYNGPDL